MHLFVVAMIVSGVILALVTGLVLYSAVRFRGKPETSEPVQTFGGRNLEIAWTVIPFLTVLWLLALTLRAMNRSDPPADRPPDLIVTGHQWWWEIRYAKDGLVTANEIHIPAGQKLLVRLESADVIHDFWAPKLARKIHMIPGHPNHIWLQADTAGSFLGLCAEYCGTQHAWMRFLVIADPPGEFAAWKRAQLQNAPAAASAGAARGMALFERMTCVNCHAIRGTGFNAAVAPDLTHFASRRTLGAGVLSNGNANLTRWLAHPQTVKPGCLMPDFKLTAAQVNDLVNYLETLK